MATRNNGRQGMSQQDAGRLGGQARSSQTQSASHRGSSQKMSRSEAGRMGGSAPHYCRGRQCTSGQQADSRAEEEEEW